MSCLRAYVPMGDEKAAGEDVFGFSDKMLFNMLKIVIWTILYVTEIHA